MIRRTCGVRITNRFTCSELRERLGTDDIITAIQQHRLRWYGHVVRQDENDWVKKCMDYEVEGARPRGRQKKPWSELIVRRDVIITGMQGRCYGRQKMRKLIEDVV